MLKQKPMADIFTSMRNIPLLFGYGRDRYTQTAFPTYNNNLLTLKSEDWVDTSNSNKFNLYNTTPHLKAVIDRKAWMKANGRYIHKKLVNGEEKIVENSIYVSVLENPNFLQNGNEFTAQRDMIKSIYGNVMIYVNAIGTKPKLLWNLPSNYMAIDRTGKIFKQARIEDVISSYNLDMGGVVEKYLPSEIIHLRDPNPIDPIMGLSRLEALMMPISNVRGALGFRNRIITSDAMLGILSSAQGGKDSMNAAPTLDKEQQSHLNSGFRSKWGMQEGKGDILQTEAAVSWNPMSYPTKELMLFEEVDDDFRAIIDAYGLNANIFSFAGKSTYENMEHGMRLAYRDTIIPESEAESLAISKHFGFDGTNEWIELNFDHLDVLKVDDSTTKKTNAETIEILLNAGLSAERVSEIVGVEIGEITRVKEAMPKV